MAWLSAALLPLNPLAQDAGEPARFTLTFIDDWHIPTGAAFGQTLSSTTAFADAPDATLENPSQAELLRRKATGDFGGLSALGFDPTRSTIYALSDTSAPVIFKFLFSAGAGGASFAADERMELTLADGRPIPPRTLDPEGIALAANGAIFVSSEGYIARPPIVEPAILEFDADGRLVKRLPVPDKFRPDQARAGRTGIRSNAGFESLTISTDGRRLYTASEGALYQDGPACGFAAGCLARIVEYDLSDPQALRTREFAYRIDAMDLDDVGGQVQGLAGLSELLYIDDMTLFALERGFAIDRQDGQTYQTIRLFSVNLADATDVSGLNGLTGAPGNVRPAAKSLLLDMRDIVGELEPDFQSLDNFEGMTLGPVFADGSRSLVFVSDNNYQQRQRTAWLVFRLAEH